MSVDASHWAWRITSIGPSAKLVLMALADYADEEHRCWPSRRMLADRSVQSPETITRRLADLEAAGLIERTARTGPNGGRTSDMIRLLIGRAPRVGNEAPEGTPPRQSDKAPLVSSDEAPSSTVTTYVEPSIEPSEERTPHIPPEGGGVGQIEHGSQEEGADTQLDVFLTAFEPDPAFSRPKARRAWSVMNSAERAEALAGVPRYRDHCAKAKRKQCDPSTYLRERRWANFAAAPVKAEAPARPVEDDPVKRAVLWAINGVDRAGWVFVEEGSDAWEAWRAAFDAAGLLHRFTKGRRELVRDRDGGWARSEQPGCNFPRRYPPGSSRPEGADPPPESGMSEEDWDAFASGG